MTISNIHENIVLKLGVALLSGQLSNVQEIGSLLIKNNSDDLSEGGIWLWGYKTNEVYYSPKFCLSLGYDYNELGNLFAGFDLANKDQFNYGVGLINDLIAEKSNLNFTNIINYTKKDGAIVTIECTGTVFYKYGEPSIILGTHKLL